MPNVKLDSHVTEALSEVKRKVAELWIRTYGIEETPELAWHMLNVVAIALYTYRLERVDPEWAIDRALGPIENDLFTEFMRDPERRRGPRNCFSEARSSAQRGDISKMSEAVQIALVMPLDGPSSLNEVQAEATVRCAAQIITHCFGAATTLPTILGEHGSARP